MGAGQRMVGQVFAAAERLSERDIVCMNTCSGLEVDGRRRGTTWRASYHDF